MFSLFSLTGLELLRKRTEVTGSLPHVLEFSLYTSGQDPVGFITYNNEQEATTVTTCDFSIMLAS